jgi:hypothetical protein
MKFLEMSELVKQHHPHMGQTEVRKILNRAIDDFSLRTGVVETSWSFLTDDGEDRWISLDDNILTIERVEIDNQVIPRLLVLPQERDFE